MKPSIFEIIMKGFKINLTNDKIIRFNYDLENAPLTCGAFDKLLPFTRTFMHAKVSGEEIWIDNPPSLDIPQENSSVFTQPGEVVFGPSKPLRNKTANCMGIYYGNGKGLDGCNIFAKANESDMGLLRELGEDIWRHGMKEVTFNSM